jgi:hypothetical protein
MFAQSSATRGRQRPAKQTPRRRSTTTPARAQTPAPDDVEILARIARGCLHISHAELRHQLRWDDHKHGELLAVLRQLEAAGLLESGLHFRLTEHGRQQLPADQRPPACAISTTPW